MAAGPHVSISPETVTYWGNLPVTNSMVTSLVVSGLILMVAIWFRFRFSAKSNRPKGIQNVLEWIVESLYNLVYTTSGDAKRARLFFPLIASFFIMILFNNWFGLIPIVGNVVVPVPHQEPTQVETTTQLLPKLLHVADTYATTEEVSSDPNEGATNPEEAETEESGGAQARADAAVENQHTATTVSLFRPGTADLNMTLALAILSIVAVQFWGVKFLNMSYFKKFFNFSSPINFFVGILELISEFSKIISFAFRLFGNIFAGEVLIVVLTFLTLIIIPVPFYGLEIFVGFIQALVFAMLSLVLFNMATHKH